MVVFSRCAEREEEMSKSLIAGDLRFYIEAEPDRVYAVIIAARESERIGHLGVGESKVFIRRFLDERGYVFGESEYYLFASVSASDIRQLAALTEWVTGIWSDARCAVQLLDSVKTVGAKKSWKAFDAQGEGITWAVLDTGIRYDHPHFQRYSTIVRQLSKNFSSSPQDEDVNGHGTHVSGIIAGCATRKDSDLPFRVATYLEDERHPMINHLDGLPSGIAPMTKLVNVKVLDDDGMGSASTVILGLEYIRKLNQGSTRIRIDGANLSLGYPIDPKWPVGGHTPLCGEVRRAVNSGIIIVTSCGNAGYETIRLSDGGSEEPIRSRSITDPASTEEAISVGSVHKSEPKTYGVSYFSSRGPTRDGRQKPDLVAPGEAIISCSLNFDHPDASCRYDYEEKSGTSFAAAHVSGAIAAFLSVHTDLRGDPNRIKEIFLNTAMSLGRQSADQGAGLLDLFRALSFDTLSGRGTGGPQAVRASEGARDAEELTSFRGGPKSRDPGPVGTKVFIGHGGSEAWLVLKNFLTDRLKVDCDEFNDESAAGVATVGRLRTMLEQAQFAFLVMTAEDVHADGKPHARENVIHEAGLFQGRLGFERAIVLLEEGCAEFSNIHGLTHIPFPRGNIRAAFEDIRLVLEREGIIQNR